MGIFLAEAEFAKEPTLTLLVVAPRVSCSTLAKANRLGLSASPKFSHQNLPQYLKLFLHIGTLTTLAG